MKPKPSNLEEVADRIIKELSVVKNVGESEGLQYAIKANIVFFVKKYLKSKCDFYLRYKDDPQELLNDWIELELKYSDYDFFRNDFEVEDWTDEDYEKYNLWLFKLAFKDVIVAKGKDEATGEAVDVTSRRQAHYNTKNQSDEGKTRANEGDKNP